MGKTYSIIPVCCLGANISDPLLKMLWIELYAMANFGETETLHRGQLSTTYQEIATRTGLTLKQVRCRIAMLVARHQLLKQKTNQGIILTIVNYDKNLNGKGRPKKDTSTSISEGCSSENQQKGNPRADKRAGGSACLSNDSGKYIIAPSSSKGRQNCEFSAQYISIRDKRDVVVREDDNSNSYSFPTDDKTDLDTIQRKQLKFKNDVLSFIEYIGWKKNLDIPAFKEAVKNYLGYYGALKGGITLCYETIKGFSIDFSLHKWINNERTLKQA